MQPAQTAAATQAALQALATPERAKASARFFKTGPGQYGEGDEFIGVAVPQQRAVARQFRQLPLPELNRLLASPVHEDRLTAVFILVMQYQRAGRADQQNIVDFYLTHTACINNWDLVDSSAGYILGTWLIEHGPIGLLDKLAASQSLWERRIAMLAAGQFMRASRPEVTLRIATKLINDPHDLIHKAVGWMLREVGKTNEIILRTFLDQYAATMPRTALRYAIEKFDPKTRRHYLGLGRP